MAKTASSRSAAQCCRTRRAHARLVQPGRAAAAAPSHRHPRRAEQIGDRDNICSSAQSLCEATGRPQARARRMSSTLCSPWLSTAHHGAGDVPPPQGGSLQAAGKSASGLLLTEECGGWRVECSVCGRAASIGESNWSEREYRRGGGGAWQHNTPVPMQHGAPATLPRSLPPVQLVHLALHLPRKHPCLNTSGSLLLVWFLISLSTAAVRW